MRPHDAPADKRTAVDPTPLLVDRREAARLLGVSERTLWTLSHSGVIRALRIGRSVRYRVASLVAYVERLEAGKRGTP